ncbi:MAG: VCBS repeat-containing protein [Acidobacteria bacterium]|nr:VCBS repeat-containing protein [Acidobacteriota bacterium]
MRFSFVKLAIIFSVAAIASCQAANPPIVPWDLTGPANARDGLPDILWRRKSNIDTYAWEMNYGFQGQPPNVLAYANHSNALPSTGDPSWKVIGTGDFNADSNQDILFQHSSGLIWVFYMNGPNYLSGAQVNGTSPGSNWKIVGVGDFGSVDANSNPQTVTDGKPDIVWQHQTSFKQSVWLMDGITYKATATIESASTSWQIVAIADFGSSAASTGADQKPDLVLADYTAGNLAIRYMNGYSQLSQTVMTFGGVNFTFAHDKDFQVVAAADWVGANGLPDLLVRHVTDGRLFFWQCNGANFVNAWVVPPSQWDTDWRMDAQSLSDSTWRLTRINQPVLSAVGGPSSITLFPYDYSLGTGQSFTIERAPANSGAFATNATGVTSYYVDQGGTLGPNTPYDYRVTAVGGGLPDGPAVTTRGIYNPDIIHSRGRVLVVIEGTLYSQASFGSYWQTFKEDLAGDGWEVIAKTDAPRHHDAWDAHDKDGLTEIKNWILTKKTGAKALILIGHVVIPYSGLEATDNHPEHATPWAADMYYGDTDGNWQDEDGNGQFSNNYAPSAIELAVGRIDFARLTALGVTDGSFSAAGAETTLIQNYLNKVLQLPAQISPISTPRSDARHERVVPSLCGTS